MQLQKHAITELRKIVLEDYDFDANDQEANELGCSLLRLARVANVALARADEKRGSSAEARGSSPLQLPDGSAKPTTPGGCLVKCWR